MLSQIKYSRYKFKILSPNTENTKYFQKIQMLPRSGLYKKKKLIQNLFLINSPHKQCKQSNQIERRQNGEYQRKSTNTIGTKNISYYSPTLSSNKTERYFECVTTSMCRNYLNSYLKVRVI